MAGLLHSMVRAVAASVVSDLASFAASGTKAMARLPMVQSFGGGTVYTSDDYEAYVREGYKANTDVYACINKIVTAGKGIKWKAYRRKARGGREEVQPRPGTMSKPNNVLRPEEQLYRLLRRPNPMQGWGTLIQNTLGFYLLHGNSYLLRVTPFRNQPPTELYVMRPDRTFVQTKQGASVIDGLTGYTYATDSGPVHYYPDRELNGAPHHLVLHMKLFNPTDEWYGMSPITAAARAIDQNNAAATWNLALLQNGAQESGVLVVPGEYDPEDEYIKTLNAMLTTRYSGPQQVGKPMLLYGGMDWKSTGMKPSDISWLEGQKLSARRIHSVYNVASELVGDSDNKTYNNQKEARKALYTETVMPLLDDVAGELNHWLIPLYGESSDDLFLDYDRDDIEAIKDERAAVWERANDAVKNSWITPNDAREAVGMERHPAPEADRLLLPSSVMPTAVGTDGSTSPSLMTPPVPEEDEEEPAVEDEDEENPDEEDEDDD